MTNDEGEVAADAPADGIEFNRLSYQPGGEEARTADEWGVVPDASCMAAHPDDPSACLDALHVLFYHLETPTCFALSGYDRFMRSEDVSACSSTYEAWSLGDYHGRLVAVAPSLLESWDGQKDPVGLPGHGVWIDNTDDHEGPTNNDKYNRELELDSGEIIALHDSLRAWVDADTAHSPLCISNGDASSNPSNPMNSADNGGTPLSADDCF